MSNALGSTDHAIDLDDDILISDISDEALEAAGGMESVPHKTGCSPDCPAYSC
jgi:hypothetical protein